MIGAARAAVVGLTALLASPAFAQAPAAPVKLEGVWGSTRHFGPEVRGTLEIVKADGAWRAQVGRFVVEPIVRDARVEFTLPDGQGSFEGTFEPSGLAIRGFWKQPKTVNDGSVFLSPVLLRADASKARWRGEVVPLDEDFTLYLVISPAADGRAAAFIRNPNRNIGLWWNVNRVEQAGGQVRLVGKFRGRGEDRVFGEGTYRAEDKVLSIYFPQRSATYDFSPIADSSAFHARPKNAPPYRYAPPIAAFDGWKTGTLSEVGLDVEPLAELVRLVSKDPTSVDDLDQHGLLIARHGKLVFEQYFHGFHRLKPHDTRSAGKTVASLLVGAAMQHGAKLDTSTRVYGLLLPGANVEPRKKEMTVEHLLTMSSGYDCDDWAGDRPGSEDHLLDDEPDSNYYRYTLQLPMEMAPGKEAVYCSINPNLIGAVVAAATRRPIADLFEEWIARPLQIGSYFLNLQPTGEPYLGGGARLLPRDFMKFGQLLLDDGMWNGRRVLPHEYVQRVGLPHVTLRKQPKDMRFGYLWWTIDYAYKGRTITGYWASGNGGQIVLVLPELDLVVAAYGGNYGGTAGWSMIKDYIPKYVLPALTDASR